MRNFPGYNEATVATYVAGEYFYYDRIYTFVDTNHHFTHRYASYVTSSNVRRYIPFQSIDAKGVVTKYANYTVE